MTKRPPSDLASPDDVIELKRQKIEVTQEISAESDGTFDGTAGGSVSKASTELSVRIDGTVNSTLFKLPAELRVVIYEYVLVEDQSITVDTGLRLPSLHSTSRQVREETVPIWYRGNLFNHPITDCDTDLMTKWNKHCHALCLPEIKQEISVSGRPNWSNLVMWCKILCDHSDGGMMLPAHNEFSKLEQVISTTTIIAERFSYEDRPWAECELVLNDMRPLLGLVDDEWLD
ncbi:hypothetical protein LTR17_005446 [Elasticomyces elasticus]|nr:hypothetical protein LTR17_005446 [Elasticomyces elasticus]